MKKLFVILFCLIAVPVSAKLEKEYQKEWCKANNGEIEVVLPDRTRIDCVTQEYAIEFDFGKKWAESVGQALYYAILSSKKPGIVLIVNSKKEQKHVDRLWMIAKKYGIRVWIIEK